MTYHFLSDSHSDIPHKCGAVLDVIKISNSKSQLVCVVCRKEIAVWVAENKKKIYPTNAKFFVESSLKQWV